MKKLLILLILIMMNFTVAVDNRFFHSCDFGTDDLEGACFLKEILLSLQNDTNSHASLKNEDYDFPGEIVIYPFHICCTGDELKETNYNNDDIWGNAPLLKLSGNTNAHAATIYSEPYWVNASFQAPGGIYCIWSETEPETNGNNEYLSILSLSTGESNNHLGNEEAYPLKLWCRGGIPMRSAPGIELPDKSGIIMIEFEEESIIGTVIDESSASEEEEFFAKKECENVDECVALIEGDPTCFTIGTEHDIDDFTGSEQPEICSEQNYWCPKMFAYSFENYQCEFVGEQCYDQTFSDLEMCWSKEKNESTSDYQNALWLADIDKCSYKLQEDGSRQSCCAATVIHGNPYQKWKNVCIFEAGGNNQDCAPGN